MASLIQKVIKAAQELLHKRSPKWKAVRARHLQQEDWCRACGGRNFLEAHHVVPFHVDRSRELDPTNLITLCTDSRTECHIHSGHLGSWRKFNPNVRKDATLPRPR